MLFSAWTQRTGRRAQAGAAHGGQSSLGARQRRLLERVSLVCAPRCCFPLAGPALPSFSPPLRCRPLDQVGLDPRWTREASLAFCALLRRMRQTPQNDAMSLLITVDDGCVRAGRKMQAEVAVVRAGRKRVGGVPGDAGVTARCDAWLSTPARRKAQSKLGDCRWCSCMAGRATRARRATSGWRCGWWGPH